MPLISIIIPMRNAEAFIDETLRSLRAQKDVEIEIIVIDDGSTDRGPAIVADHASRDPRIRMIPGPQRGISAAFNTGLAEARGELLCRCDADDLYPHERLAQQQTWLDGHPDHIALAGGYATVMSDGKLVDEFVVRDGVIDITDDLLAGRGRSHVCAYLFRTDAVRRVGGCREYFETSEDADLQFRLAQVGRIGYAPVVTYFYRLHDASITHQVRSARREFFERTAVAFAQQRGESGQDDLMRGNPPIPPVGGGSAGQSTRRQVQKMLIGRAWKEHRAGRRWPAVATGLRAAMIRPFSLSAWKSVVALMVK